MADLKERYTFENYQTPTPKHAAIKQKAQQFVTGPAEGFIISGQSGSGKTHICTAICCGLMERGKSVRYFAWRRQGAELKAMVNEREEYRQRLDELRKTSVLYIDDFLKGSVTEADINLAFSILNDRYNAIGKKTIISTERSMANILELDEAVGGRIADRARGYVIQAPNENWRLFC